MECKHDESAGSPDDENNIISFSNSSSSANLSSVSGNSVDQSCFAAMSTQISSNTEVQVIINIWMDMFKENPNIGTIKLFTIVIRCFHVDISACESMDLNSVIMFERIIKCFKFMDKTGSLILPEVIKRSLDVFKTSEFLTLIFQYHSDLFFSNDVNKKYFIFLRDVLVKISQCDYIGPRFLATSFGLKIITGLLKYNNSELTSASVNLLLKSFLIKRWKDISCIVRETVLLELDLWIQLDFNYFIDKFWKYIYWALCDQSTNVQILALKISKHVLNLSSDNSNLKLLVKKIITILANLLLSKNEEVVILAFNLFSIIQSLDDEDELCTTNIKSITLELMFSENFNVAQFAAKNFVEQMVDLQPNESEKIKLILIILRGIPEQLMTVSISFFVNVIYDLCPVLTNFKLISQILNLENYIEDIDKCNLMLLLMYVVQWSITGVRPTHETTILGNQNYIAHSHINTVKKKEFTTYLLIHLLNQLKDCEEPLHILSLWILFQFIDFELLQDKMILPDILKHAFSYYQSWNIPSILEMVSKCIQIMTSNLKGYEQDLCFKKINDIAAMNINILKAGIENSLENTPSLLIQKNSLIKLWSLAKYNDIPDDMEPLKYLSDYIPNLNNARPNLIVSEFALNAYMEIFRKQLLKLPNNLNNESSLDSVVENTFFSFLDAMFNTLSKYDPQTLYISETAFLIVNELLRINYDINHKIYILTSDHNSMLTNYIFSVCRNCKHNNDLNTLKLLQIYIQLIQDGLIDVNHLITPLQFVNMELFERVLRPIFNFLCKKETGGQLSNVINLYLVYMFENVVSQKSEFKNSTIKEVINAATVVTRLLSQCTDQVGKRLISTNIHRHGIQYAMSDNLNNSYSNYPFKQFFWVLASMCDILVSYDAQRLADYFLDKPATQELITNGNEHVLRYLYKLQVVSSSKDD